MKATSLYGFRRGIQSRGVMDARRKYTVIIYSMALRHFVGNRHARYWGLIRWLHVHIK